MKNAYSESGGIGITLLRVFAISCSLLEVVMFCPQLSQQFYLKYKHLIISEVLLLPFFWGLVILRVSGLCFGSYVPCFFALQELKQSAH